MEPYSTQLTLALITLHNHCLHGSYTNAHTHLQQLSPSTRSNALIVIESAYLYLIQGKIKLAVQTLDSYIVPREPQSQESKAILGCLTLMKAYASVHLECRLLDAWEKAVKIRRELLEPGLGWNLDPEQETGVDIGPEHGESNDSQRVLSTVETLLVFWYHKIALTLADQSILSLSHVQHIARRHLLPVMTMLRREARIEEERILLHIYTDALPSQEDKITALTHFLSSPSAGHELQHAQTHLDLARFSRDEVQVIEHLRKASELFETSGHSHGNLDAMVFWTTRGSEQSALEKVRGLRGAAAEYARLEYVFGEFRALSAAMGVVALFPGEEELAVEWGLMDTRVTQILVQNGAEWLRREHAVLTLAYALKRESDVGGTLQALEMQRGEMREGGGWKARGMLENLGAICYEILGNHEMALECERESFRYHSMGKNYIDISDSTLLLAVRMSTLGLSSNTLHLLQEASELLEDAVVKDEEAALWENAYEKYQQLAHLEMNRHQRLGITGAWEKFISWREKLVPAQHGWSEALMTQIPINLMLVGKYKAAAEFSLEVLAYHRAIGSTPEKITAVEMRVSLCFFGIGMDAKKAAALEGTEEEGDDGGGLQSATEILEKVFGHYETSNVVSMTVWCAVILARARRRLSSDSSTNAAGFEKAIGFFTRAEAKCDELRQEIWASSGLQALLEKRQVVSKEEHRALYSEVLEVCVEAGETALAWAWVQKGKARGLADMLGWESPLSRAQRGALEGDPAAGRLLERERELVEAVGLAMTPPQVISSRKLLKTHQEEMRQNPLLAQYLSAREGVFDFISLDSIFASLSSTHIPPGSKIVLVDWAVLSSGRIAMLTVDSRKQPQLHHLDIKITAVEKWLRDHFHFTEGEEPDLHQVGADRILAKLNGLVSKLSDCTAENDLLVLSPTGLLHQLPLHALRVGGRVLIDRNLVVYSSSLSVLRNCLNRAETKIAETQTVKAAFLGVYEEEDNFDERRNIFECVKTEADHAGSTCILGPDVTSETFVESIQDADWVHFHGHVTYDASNILAQGLVLSDGVDIFADYEAEASPEASDTEDECSSNSSESSYDPHTTLFPLPSIFPLSLPATHLTLIACSSSAQQISPGDEPLGIVSAFLTAGAASAVGTLWPTLSPAGRAFTEAFYGNLRAQKSGGGEVVSLAVAVREAVRVLRGREETGSPYCWAPFVLCGSWFCRGV